MDTHTKWRILILSVILVAISMYCFTKLKLIEVPEKNSIPITTTPEENRPIAPESKQIFQSPIQKAKDRITKKPFGIFITRVNSPVQPERFSGYHTGADFEIFPEELDASIEVKAICDGTLLVKKYASGYGGVVVQSCRNDASPITVIYGHLKLGSIGSKEGDIMKQGDTIGILGAEQNTETDGERKHLHLGVHQGLDMNILGYVSQKSDLSGWIDPLSLFPSAP